MCEGAGVEVADGLGISSLAVQAVAVTRQRLGSYAVGLSISTSDGEIDAGLSSR